MKPKAVLLTKIAPPHVEKVLLRKQLFRKLDRLRRRPVIWISAPAGTGKTTLATTYINTRKLPFLWFRLDKGDEDIAGFFHYLGLAAKQAAPRKRRKLPSLTPEYMPGLFSFTRNYFAELFSLLKSQSLIVFDNYQEVTQQSGLHEVIREGLGVIPSGITVILISRTDPLPVMSRLQANDHMTVLNWDDLKLTEKESFEIARLRGAAKKKKINIGQIHRMTQGWTAGLVLMLEQSSIGNMEPVNFSEMTQQTLFDYFASEVLHKVDTETQNFLIKTAFLRQMTSRASAQLTGSSQTRQILTSLTSNNFFTFQYTGKYTWYHYHPLFREFLINRAKEIYTQEQLKKIYTTSAFAMEEEGRIEDAIELFSMAENWEEMVRLILNHALPFINQGRGQTLASWIMELPKELLDESAWLQFWMGNCRLAFNIKEAMQYFENAFNRFNKERDRVGALLAWSGIVDTIVYQWDDFSTLDRWIAWLDEQMQADQTFPSPEIEGRVACSMAGALMFRQPHRKDIAGWFERAWLLAQKNTDHNLCIQTGFTMIYYYMFVGQHIKAKNVFDRLEILTGSTQPSPLVMIMLKVMESHLHQRDGITDSSREALHEGIQVSRTSGVHVKDAFLYSQGAYFTLAIGDFTGAQEYLGKMAAALELGGRILDTGHYHYLKAWDAFIRDDYPSAIDHSESALRLTIEAGAPFPQAMSHLGLAWSLFEQRNMKKAKYHLSESLNIARKTQSISQEYHALIAAAYFAFKQNNENEGIYLLGEAMTLGKSNSYIHYPVWWRSHVMTILCTKALEAGIETDYVKTMIRQRNLIPDIPPVECEDWPWALKIYTLGRFSVVKDSSPISFTSKAQRKPMEFLKALIALGGREVHENQLTDILWPDAEGDKDHWNFATTLKRLRKLLGHENAIVLSHGCLSLDTRYCWVDIWSLERIISSIEEMLRKKTKCSEDQLKNLTRKAVHLYQGDFFVSDALPPWGVSKRDHLLSRFKFILEETALYWEQAGNCRESIFCYLKGLQIDDLSEALYQRLMSCYQRLGFRSDAITVYIRCKKTLSAKLGIDPSPETEAMYKRLIEG